MKQVFLSVTSKSLFLRPWPLLAKERTFKIFVSVLFWIFSSVSQAGWLDFGKDQCKAAIELAPENESLVESSSEEHDDGYWLERAQTLIQESREFCAEWAGSGARFCFATAKSLPGILLRSWRFSPSIENVREQIVIPLAGRVEKLNDRNLSVEDREKAMQEFILFWPELILKFERSIPKLALTASFNGIGTILSIGKNEAAASYQREALKLFMGSILKNYRESGLAETRLSFMERIQFAFLQAGASIGDEVSRELGLDHLRKAFQNKP